MNLAAEHCEDCPPGAPMVTNEEIEQLMPQIPDWSIVDVDGVPRLRRIFEFPDFKSAWTFTNGVADLAETVGHHPLIELTWGVATISWWCHKIDGIHRSDFVMAARTDLVFAAQ